MKSTTQPDAGASDMAVRRSVPIRFLSAKLYYLPLEATVTLSPEPASDTAYAQRLVRVEWWWLVHSLTLLYVYGGE
jgi:hypothetical protein